MIITMATEGTYPYAAGGVSVWCDQLVSGISEHDFRLVAITGSGRERLAWQLPPNVREVVNVPMWGPPPRWRAVGRERRQPGQRRDVRRDLVRRLGQALLEPDLTVARQDFSAVLRDWSLVAPSQQLEPTLISQEFVGQLLDRWCVSELVQLWGGRGRGLPTVADAVTATRLIAHSLRPLSVPGQPADVTHLAANGIAGLPGLSAKWWYGTPFVLSEHGVYLRERYLAFGRLTYSWPVKWLLLRFHRLLAATVYAEAAMVAPGNVYNQRWETADGVPEEVIRTVYNGVDPAEFALAEQEPEVPTLTWAGRIDPVKDLETLIRAFALVRERVPGSRLRIFGGTPAGNEDYRQMLFDLRDSLGLGDSISFEGRVEQIRDAYVAGHVVALTSISEGFPYTVIEAMSCGRATVSTDVGGVKEAVGHAGLVVGPRRPQEFADACVRLLTDTQERHRLAELARRRVVELFTLERSLDAFRAIYTDLASAHPTEAFWLRDKFSPRHALGHQGTPVWSGRVGA